MSKKELKKLWKDFSGPIMIGAGATLSLVGMFGVQGAVLTAICIMLIVEGISRM
jgi:uncharacterized protein (DUF2062 family)|tara:strand:- start:427 stop:588 length:162 start_codon:yes stop_codon:yes gene_type:complete